MNRGAPVLERPANAGLETGQLADRPELASKPRSSPGPGRSTIDLLLVYSPTARPLPSRNGVRRWEYRGRIYREIPLEALYAWDDEDPSTREFCRMDSLIRAKPHRRRAA
jgi:hypothetical protein